MVALTLILIAASPTKPNPSWPSAQILAVRTVGAGDQWALARDGSRKRVLRSFDKGRVWHDASPDGAFEINDFAARSPNEAWVHAVAEGKQWTMRSTDHGRFWEVAPVSLLELQWVDGAEAADGGTDGSDVFFDSSDDWRLQAPPVPNLGSLIASHDYSGTFNGAPFFATLGLNEQQLRGWLWYQTARGGFAQPVIGKLNGEVLTLNELDDTGKVVSSARLRKNIDGYAGRWWTKEKSGKAALKPLTSAEIGKKRAFRVLRCEDSAEHGHGSPPVPCKIDVSAPWLFGEADPARGAELQSLLSKPFEEMVSGADTAHGMTIDYLSRGTSKIATFLIRERDDDAGDVGSHRASAVSFDLERRVRITPGDVVSPKPFSVIEDAVLRSDAQVDCSGAIGVVAYCGLGEIGLTSKGIIVCGTDEGAHFTYSRCIEAPYAVFKKALRDASPYTYLWAPAAR